MAQRSKDPSFRALIEGFASELAEAVATHVEAHLTQLLRDLPAPSNARTANGIGSSAARGAKPDGRRAGRLCPVPGCGQPGAGPRNRWFCRDHASKLSVEEQKGILERNRRLASEGKLPTAVPAQRIVRLPTKEPRARRALDMTCRVVGCPNRSRGPRAGFICDQHRAELTPDEQRETRERYYARLKDRPAPSAAPVSEPPRPPPMAVPPIVRKAEPADVG